jgi:RNA polymerase sigma factor for flagellar operon FliA
MPGPAMLPGPAGGTPTMPRSDHFTTLLRPRARADAPTALLLRQHRDALEAMGGPPGTPREAAALLEAARAGDRDARHRLWLAYLPLAVHATTLLDRRNIRSPEDVVQDAMVGLGEAIAGFDPGRGCSFGTYARMRAVSAILRGNIRDRPIRLPVNAWREARAYLAAANGLEGQTGTIPTAEAVAAHAGFSRASLPRILAAAMALKFKHLKVAPEALRFGDDDEARRLHEAIGRLAEAKPKLADAVRRVYGLDGHPETPMAEVARQLGVGHTLVLQRVRAAIARLRPMLRPPGGLPLGPGGPTG